MKTSRTSGASIPHATPQPEEMVAGDEDTVDRSFVTSLGRGLKVLTAFADRRRPMTMAEVSRRTNLPRASVGRSLYTLAKLGYLAEDAEHRFFLRPKVVTFAHAYLSFTPLTLAAQPVLDRLSTLVKASCSLAVLDDDHIVYLVRSASSHVMHPVFNTGRRLPACYTAIGRVILANGPREEVERYLSRLKLVRFTEHTIGSVDEMRQVLQAAREQGYASADRQMTNTFAAVAVPVRDARGTVIAGINIISPIQKISLVEMQELYLDRLKAAAAELGHASTQS